MCAAQFEPLEERCHLQGVIGEPFELPVIFPSTASFPAVSLPLLSRVAPSVIGPAAAPATGLSAASLRAAAPFLTDSIVGVPLQIGQPFTSIQAPFEVTQIFQVTILPSYVPATIRFVSALTLPLGRSFAVAPANATATPFSTLATATSAPLLPTPLMAQSPLINTADLMVTRPFVSTTTAVNVPAATTTFAGSTATVPGAGTIAGTSPTAVASSATGGG